MMRRNFYITCMLIVLLVSCKDDDINVFDKSADERAAEAIASLKAELVAPENGWKLKYTPVPESGSFYILLNFNDDNKVTIKTDFASEDDKYLEQTITYRIDNSLGIELIFENYSFFSHLFEQNSATFEAEFEFYYVTKTGNALVFESKTDTSDPTQIVLEPASADDENLLGNKLSKNLQTLSDDLDIFSSSYKITFTNKDLILYASLNDFERTINVHSSTKKSDTQTIQKLNFNSAFVIKGDSLVLNDNLKGTFSGNSINIKGFKFNDLIESSITVCTDPLIIHGINGFTSSGDAVTIESSLQAANGKNFGSESYFYYAPLSYIFNNGVSAEEEITQNLTGAGNMQLYYGVDFGNGTTNAIGFYLENADGSITYALKEFSVEYQVNNMIFTFADGFLLFENETPDATLENINIYLDLLTEGNNTYVYKYSDGIYEFNNPCNGWSFVFLDGTD